MTNIKCSIFRVQYKYHKSDDEPYDNNPESASSTKGTITLIHDYVNKR